MNDIDVIEKRLVNHYLDKSNICDAVKYLKTQDEEGKWANVKYEDSSLTDWLPLLHLDKVYDMVIAYKDPANISYQSIKLLDGIIKGIEYWFTRKPVSENWWHNQIGQQLRLGPIILMMKEKLSKEQIEKGSKFLYDPAQIKATLTTGQNLMWFASETIIRGLINQDEIDIHQGFDYINNEIKITTDEGVQPDYSFYQHGPQLYNGGYGLGFIKDASRWAAISRETKFSFDKVKIDILIGLLLDGDRWMVRGKNFDLGAQGRELTRKGSLEKAVNLLNVCNDLAKLAPDRRVEIEALKDTISGTKSPCSIIGNKYFWRADYMVHQREKFFTSIKMVSARTIGTEMLISENVKGFWLPFGFTCILQRGDEYEDIFPVWDWARLPGVTCPYCELPIKRTVSQDSRFVGGVSDGIYGVAAMVTDKQKTTAKKSWFFFDDEFVALGAGINSEDEYPVSTTLNQCLLNGKVIIDGKDEFENKDMRMEVEAKSWILHDDIGYIFLTDSLVNLKTTPQCGTWKSINEQYSDDIVLKDIFALWIDHGMKSKDASYKYVVVPGVKEKNIKEYSSCPPVSVLSNTSEIQAVKHEKIGVTGIVFYYEGKLNINNSYTISADKPCMVLIKDEGNRINMSVSNPLAAAETVIISISIEGKTNRMVFDLPGEDLGGISVTKTINIL